MGLFSSLDDMAAVIWMVVCVILGNCDIVSYHKEYTFDLSPHFWHKTPKTPEIL